MGKISSLPTNILNDNISFERGENSEKFSAGPTAFRPGPTLFIVVAIAVKFVVKSKLSMLIANKVTMNIAA